MIIAIEIDGMISSSISSVVSSQEVSQCEAIPGVKEALDQIKSLGHIIFIYSHRDASLGPATEVWLQKHKIPYDLVMFNKPKYDIVLDQKSQRLESWNDFLEKNKYRLHNSK